MKCVIFTSVPIFRKHGCINACTGYFSVLSPSSLPFRSITVFLLVRSQMLIVTPSIARKRVGEESSAKGRETVSLWSIVIANKDVGILNQQTISLRSCLFSRKQSLIQLFDS